MENPSRLPCQEDLSDSDVMKLCDQVREIGFALHQFLGPGFRELVYERGMIHRLSKAGLNVLAQPCIKVHDEDGTLLAEDRLDLVIEKALVVELKASREIHGDHVAQILGYLKATNFRHGLLINFGSAKFQIKKYVF